MDKKYSDAKDLLKNKTESEKMDAILWEGDLNEVEYGELTQEEINKIKAENPENSTQQLKQARIKKFCEETDETETIAKAYFKIREIMTAVYHAIDNANRRPQNKAEFLSDKKINELKENKFVRINKISETEDDEKKLVMYTEYPHGKPKDETQNNIVAAVQGESYGNRGRKSTVYESVWDRIVRGIGFNSVNKAWENGERRIIQTRGREKVKREKQRAIDKYLANPTFENAAEKDCGR